MYHQGYVAPSYQDQMRQHQLYHTRGPPPAPLYGPSSGYLRQQPLYQPPAAVGGYGYAPGYAPPSYGGDPYGQGHGAGSRYAPASGYAPGGDYSTSRHAGHGYSAATRHQPASLLAPAIHAAPAAPLRSAPVVSGPPDASGAGVGPGGAARDPSADGWPHWVQKAVVRASVEVEADPYDGYPDAVVYNLTSWNGNPWIGWAPSPTSSSMDRLTFAALEVFRRFG